MIKMSEENIRGQISAKEDEITRIEEDASKKDAAAESEIEAEYDPQIEEITTKLAEEEGLRDEAIEKAEEWTQKKKEKIAAAKDASKTLSKLKSEKDKALNSKLKEIAGDKKTKIKEVESEIKGLKKDLAALEKEKAAAAAAAAEE
jgi:chromosome segregation ATPase